MAEALPPRSKARNNAVVVFMVVGVGPSEAGQALDVSRWKEQVLISNNRC
jgi:hypothetical protein